MSPVVNSETVIVISSDDDFECDYFDVKRPRHRKRVKEASVRKKHRVNFVPKSEHALPRKKEKKCASVSNPHKDFYDKKSYETTLSQKSHDVLSLVWPRGCSLSSSSTHQRESDKKLLDIRCSSWFSDYKSNSENVIGEPVKKETVKLLSEIVPKLPKPESSEMVQKKGLSWRNFTKIQSSDHAELLPVQILDFRPKEDRCQTRGLKIIGTENNSQLFKLNADEKTELRTKLDDFIDSLRFKQGQFDTAFKSKDCEKSYKSEASCDPQSNKSTKTNRRSELHESKYDFSNQNDTRSGDFLSSCDTFFFGNNFRNKDKLLSKDISPDTGEEDRGFERGDNWFKRKPLTLDKSIDVSSGDESDTELLPDLDVSENQSSNDKPLQIFTSTKNVDTVEKCTKSSWNIQHTSLPTFRSSVPTETEAERLLTESDCSLALVKCHLYLEFPPFLPEPSSNSWLKHCSGDCKETGSSNVSEFSRFKVFLVNDLIDAFAVNAFTVNSPSACSRKRSKRGPVYEERLVEDIHFTGTSCPQVSTMFRNLASFKSQPTVDLTATLLKHLSCSKFLRDSYSLHRALKGAVFLHPRRNSLPFSSELLFEVLENVSKADKNRQQHHHGSILTLDFMISCLEMEFLINFQAIGLRRSRKTKLFELFNSNSTLRNVQTQLLVACQRYDPKDPIHILPLLQRLLGIAGVVVIAGVDGIAQVGSMLVGEYELCDRLSVRVALLESISFPFHRFAVVRQVLERWRYRSISCSLRSLMVSDVGDLLDAYFTDRFLSTLPTKDVEQISTEFVEELVMLLYTLVESYLHTKRDCLASSYWEKIGLNDQTTESVHNPSSNSLSLLPGYVDLLRSFLVHHLSPTEKLSRRTCLYLVKLECLADLCVHQ